MVTLFQQTAKPAHRAARRIGILFSYTLMLIGTLALVYAGYVVEDARNYQERAVRAFENARSMAPGSAGISAAALETAADVSARDDATANASEAAEPIDTKSSTASALSDGIIGRLEVPRIGLSVMIAEGDSNAVLRRAVGHLSETALPGQTGNAVFAGHRDTYFRPLRDIRVGDAITIETVGNSYQYKVEWFRVMPPDNVSVLAPSQSNELTLITCFPFNFIGSAPDRFVVRAKEVGAGGRVANAE